MRWLTARSGRLLARTRPGMRRVGQSARCLGQGPDPTIDTACHMDLIRCKTLLGLLNVQVEFQGQTRYTDFVSQL